MLELNLRERCVGGGERGGSHGLRSFRFRCGSVKGKAIAAVIALLLM